MRSTRARAAALCAAAAAAIVTLAGCSSGPAASTDAAGAEATRAASEAAPDRFEGLPPAAGSVADGPTDGGGKADGGAAGAAAAPQPAGVPVDGSKVIKTANLSVRLIVTPVAATADPAADTAANATARSAAVTSATANVRGITAAAGGFVSGADGGGSQMSINLRVPADQYDAVVDKLAALGELTNRNETSQDVTADLVDVQSRVDSMTASVTRVRTLLGQATTIADIISIESELAQREADLESLQQRQAALQGRVAMSTISLALVATTDEPTAPRPAGDDSGFLAGVQAGWAALLGFLGWLGGAIGAVLPFVPVLAVAGLLIWWLSRRLRRPSRRAAVSPAGTPPGGEPALQPEPESVGAGSA